MSSVFLSYKREDEVRVSALARALEEEGFKVWWDQNLPGGEAWRTNIEKALSAASCVIVLWTRASVSSDGGFVIDEASRANARGVLIPVRAERVSPPLGFGELQSVDLVHWRGARSDPSFKDLVAAVRAKIDGRPAPTARGPVVRLYRRVAAGATAVGVAAAIIGFAMNALNVQDQICTAPLGQPTLSDFCGAVGLGHRPQQAERIAWERRAPGDCATLADFARNPDGYYRSIASDMYGARTLSRDTNFTPMLREWRSYVRASELPLATEQAARADALAHAQEDAVKQGCAPRSEHERLIGANINVTSYDCRLSPRGGHVCALDYAATCRTEVRSLVERCP